MNHHSEYKIWVLNPPFLPKFSRAQRSPAVTKSGTVYFPMWLSFLVGVLEDDGFDVAFNDAPVSGLCLQDVVSFGQRFNPRLVVMDTSTPSIENDIKVAAELKKILPQTIIIMVGTHVSALPGETMQKASAVDAIARREYEYTIRDLARKISENSNLPLADILPEIKGLTYRLNGQTHHNPDREFIKDLDELPWVSKVYHKYLDVHHYFNPNAPYPMVTLTTSRGCPFRCSFCVYPQTLTGRRFRFRSISDVVAEMSYVQHAFPQAKSIFFEDDTLTANKKRCLELADAIQEHNLRIPWVANSRIDLDYETMRRLKASGCRELCVGFESGDQAVLDGMQKGTRISRMFDFMRDAKRAGILIHGCFIFGFPNDTPEGIQKTIDLAIKLQPDTVQFYPVMVYPGTEAYDEYREKKWLTAQRYSQWLTPEGLHNCVVRNRFFTSNELVRLCDLARRRFYLRPGYIVYKGCQILKRPAEFIRTIKAARTFFKHLLLGSRV